jgi:hypothetical protein
MKKRLYAFYSEKADLLGGHSLYKTIEGNVVKVTLATLDPIEAYVLYKWEDKEFLGEVSECVRQNNNYRMRVRMQEKIENETELFSTSLRRFYSRFWNG